jgi:hypothetical protein
MLDLLAQPHNSRPYVQIAIIMVLAVGAKPNVDLKPKDAFSNRFVAAYWIQTVGHKTDFAVRNDTKIVSDSSEKEQQFNTAPPLLSFFFPPLR